MSPLEEATVARLIAKSHERPLTKASEEAAMEPCQGNEESPTALLKTQQEDAAFVEAAANKAQPFHEASVQRQPAVATVSASTPSYNQRVPVNGGVHQQMSAKEFPTYLLPGKSVTNWTSNEGPKLPAQSADYHPLHPDDFNEQELHHAGTATNVSNAGNPDTVQWLKQIQHQLELIKLLKYQSFFPTPEAALLTAAAPLLANYDIYSQPHQGRCRRFCSFLQRSLFPHASTTM
jgi:hypothetical protein